jgi:hypothetical protein
MSFEEKGRGEELLNANKDEIEFRLIARRNKMLGLWLAEIFGIPDADSYAKEVVIADLEEPGDEDVIRKVMKDIAQHNAGITEDDIRDKLASLTSELHAEK